MLAAHDFGARADITGIKRGLKMTTRQKLIAGCSIIAIALTSTGVFAQGMEEIVVTARKKTETLLDVPLSVTAVSGVEIEKLGLDNVTDLYGRVPGLYFAKGSITNPTNSNNYLIIRGVGWNAGLEPAVGVFIDGMYMPQIGYDLAFLDLERVEVLRGPQGSLFGRNTQGGAVNMVTRKPNEDFRGNVRLEYGRFDSLRATGTMSGQIGDNLYASVGADYDKTDGYIRNVVLNQDATYSERVSARSVIRWTPSDALEVNLIADISTKTFNEMMRGVPIGPRKYETFSDQEGDDHSKNRGAQINIDYNISDSVKLTSISGYRKSVADAFGDTDTRVTNQTISIVPVQAPFTTAQIGNQGAATPYESNHRYLSQELRLAGTAQQFDWQIGGYYFDQNAFQYAGRYLGAGVAFPFQVYIDQRYTTGRNGWAGFGQASYRPMDRLEITAGARYSEEDIDLTGFRFQYTTAFSSFAPDLHKTTTNFSLMGSISYKVTDQSNIYFTYAEGWKPGGFNPAPSSTTNAIGYDDETSTNYELGFKSNWAENRVSLNASLFWIDIKGQQVFNFITPKTAGALPTSAIENAASSRVKGFEVELNATPAEGLTFSGNFALNDTKFNSYTRRYSATDAFVMDGLKFENTPEKTASLAVDYSVPVSDSNKLEFSLNWRYVDDVIIQDNFIGARSNIQTRVPSYDRLDGRISVVSDGGWTTTLYVNNILNSFDYTDDTSDPYQFTVYPHYVKPLEPRKVGIVVAKKF